MCITYYRICMLLTKTANEVLSTLVTISYTEKDHFRQKITEISNAEFSANQPIREYYNHKDTERSETRAKFMLFLPIMFWKYPSLKHEIS